MRAGTKRTFKIVAGVLLVAIAVAGAVLLVQNKRAALERAPRYGLAPTPVRVATARRGSLETSRAYLAVVEPGQTAHLSARLTSRVESVTVDEGQMVQAGRPLVVLDDREIASAIEAAEANVLQAEAEVAANEATVAALENSLSFATREANRMRQLLASGAAAASETEAMVDKANQLTGQLEAARSRSGALQQQVEALRKRVAEQETRLSYSTISSPFNGVVTDRQVDPGDQAAPGKVLLVVEDRSTMKLAFDIPQQDVASVRPGMAVQFEGDDGQQSARITRLFPSLNQARMLRAEALLEKVSGEKFESGSYVPVSVVLGRLSDATLVPAAALVDSPEGQPYVFTVRNGRLEAIEVAVRGRSGEDVAVEGIEPGTEVVLSTYLGWSKLSSGLLVEAVR